MSKNPILHATIKGEGEPLLILHGYFGMSDNWKTLADEFSNTFQVHIIDQRNHGRSFHDDDFDYELLIEDLYKYIYFRKQIYISFDFGIFSRDPQYIQ